MRRVLVALLLLLLAPLAAVTLSSGGAQAAAASLGLGQQPAVAVDDAGTAHVVWNGLESTNRTLVHCRLPRGASECASLRVLPAPGDTVSRPFVMVSGSTVLVYTARYGGDVPGFRGLYRVSSSDGGATFTPPVLVGTLEFRDAGVGPGDGVSVATHANSEGLRYQRVSTTGTDQVTTSADLSQDRVYGGTVGLVSPHVPLVVFADGSGSLASRQYDGSGDVNESGNWFPEVPLGPGDSYSEMASSDAGLFLLSGGNGLQVRRHDGAGFGPPVTIPGSSATSSRDLVHDGGGLLVAAWAQLGVSGHSLEVASWVDGSAIARTSVVTVPGDMSGLRLGLAPDHRGVGVWDSGPASGGSRTVSVAAIDARTPVPTPAPSPPDTILLAGPAQGSTVGGPPTFEFASDTAGATFECSVKPAQLDDQQGPSWVACSSPFTPPARGFGYLRFRVRAVAGGAADPTPVTVDYFNDPAPYGNMRIRGIDVYQVVQPLSGARMFGLDGSPFTDYCGGGTPTAWVRHPVQVGAATLRSCLRGGEAQRVRYQGVTLDTGKPATAFVHVDMEGAAAVDPKQPLEVSLWATLPNGRQAGPTLVKRITDPGVSHTPYVTLRERVRVYAPESTAVEFDVPRAWLTTIPVDLHASVRFAVGTRSWNEAECAGDTCEADNRFTLLGVPKASTPAVVMAPLMLRTADTELVPSTFPFPETTFATSRHLLPGGERMRIGFFRGTLDVSAEMALQATPISFIGLWVCNGMAWSGSEAAALRACRQGAVSARMEEWALENPAREQDGARVRRYYDLLVGVGSISAGVQWGDNLDAVTGAASSSVPRMILPPTSRPLTSITHEIAHAYTAPHAGQDCDGTRVGETQQGEAWPGDDRGRLQSIGFDRRATLGARIFNDDVAAPYFDLMSYCASTTDQGTATNAAQRGGSWLSARNWNRTLAAVTAFARRVGARATVREAAGRATSTGYAVGSVADGHGVITRVGAAAQPVDGDAASPYVLRSLSEDGAVLLEAGARVFPSSEGAGGTFLGPVASGSRAVELVHHGVVLSRLAASATPTVRLRAPKAGKRVREKGRLVVRWRSNDPDGTPLRASVRYSPDGRTWRTVYSGSDTGRAVLRGDTLPGGRKARVRVVVTDGFSQAQDTSRRIRVDGRRPDVRIVSPVSGERLLAGQKVRLVAEALDPWGEMLRKKSVTWFVGRRQIGRGMTLGARLPAGKVTLKAVARDASGRTRADSIKVRVAPDRIRLTRLDARQEVGRKARRLTVRVAASGKGTLVVGGRSFRVGEDVRKLRVPLPAKPRRGVVRLKVTLIARGAQTGRVKAFVEVRRGR